MRNLFFLLSLMLLSGCSEQSRGDYHLKGNAQGTTFSIKYHGEGAKDLSREVELILIDMDKSLSLWKEESFISKVNAMEGTQIGIPADDRFFTEVLQLSREVHDKTKGYYDPSIYPLIKAWGFGAVDKVEETPDVQQLKQHCGFGLYDAYVANVGPERLFIKTEGRQFDFNGLAQGYTVDVLAKMLRLNGVEDFMVEVGGELITSGVKQDGSAWKIGIDKPVSSNDVVGGEREIQRAIEISGKAMATSGSYRKFYEKDGKKYSHTIDPFTGFPVNHQLLSVTVVMDQCALADAYATAFMCMGIENTKGFVSRSIGEGIEVFLIYEEEGQLRTFGNGRFQAP